MEWFVGPLAMCLVLTGIHGYLGIHVLERKVIFVDLAMAQIAALGAAYAVFLGYDPKHEENAAAIYLFSLGFTLAGAAVIALTRMKHERVPQEALIGIVYASAGALAILVLSKSPTEGEQIKQMLVGRLLTIRLDHPKLWLTAGIYAVIGAFHWFFRRPFFLISADTAAAEREGVRVRLWDFLFYVTFGVVITSSVSVVGVLLVFSYLVVPAVVAVLFARRTRARVGIAWGVGVAASVAGILFSDRLGFPTGPAIVAAFAAALVAAGLVHYVASHERSGVAVGRLAAAGVVVALALWGTSFLRKVPEEHGHENDEFARLVASLRSSDQTTILDAIHHLEKTGDAHAVEPLVGVLRTTTSDLVLEHAAEALAHLGSPEAVPALREAAARDLDPFLHVTLGRALLELQDGAGFAALLRVLEKGEPREACEEASRAVEEKAGLKLGYGTDPKAALERFRKWWAQRGPAPRWRPESRRFE